MKLRLVILLVITCFSAPTWAASDCLNRDMKHSKAPSPIPQSFNSGHVTGLLRKSIITLKSQRRSNQLSVIVSGIPNLLSKTA